MDEFLLSAGAQAFGDGSHESTRGALEMLGQIDPGAFSPRRACDMGAGSGILSLAMLRQFGCPVVAVDIARDALETIRENFRASGDSGQLTVIHADGFGHPEIAAHAPYDLIVMNILPEPLLKLAADANDHLAPGGALILAGILLAKESIITQSYQSLALELTARIVVGDWVTLLWQKE